MGGLWRICLILLILTACAIPSELIHKQAVLHGFMNQRLNSKQFILNSYINKPFCVDNKIHIYIPDDGTPWSSRNDISLDPNSRYSLLLDLMAIDNTSSQYLGRPCYLGYHQAEGCHPLYWTYWRYSKDVVDSMSFALRQQLDDYPNCKVTLIGYSGGGTLAMLIAPQLLNVKAVITIAGNIDIDAWSELHSYSPLEGSLNPAVLPPLPSYIKQLHLMGSADTNIPPSIVKDALQRQPEPQILHFENFTHECCWRKIWPSILKIVDQMEKTMQ
ncbi:lipase (class 3) [Nitrosomonas sp. Nm84]|uniref:alpha/beta hydrolase n=1 Tax=Nitrosomonas sp. Nm84 TaxID=200124 RepID=UPI000D77195A|nr:alpha/beta hydrolase [Nitrosomonas sp. Nm84]PXW86104.1 lipase (class 3) [Nitrosomonas sp. Nm84]